MQNLHNCIFERIVTPIEDMLLNYKLYQNIIAEEAEEFREVYSLSIIVAREEKIKEIYFYDISRNKEKAFEILRILAEGEVCTYSAPYIIEELIP